LLNVGAILRESIDRKKYMLSGADSGFMLTTDSNSATVRGPDVAVSVREPVSVKTGYLTRTPILAVEIISPSNSAADMERKIRDYFSAGSAEIWLLYPQTQHLHVCRLTGEARVYKSSERFHSVLGPEFEVAPFCEI